MHASWQRENRCPLNRVILSRLISYCCLLDKGKGRCQRLLAIPTRAKLELVPRYVLDEKEFLSPYGIRYPMDAPFFTKEFVTRATDIFTGARQLVLLC